MKPPIIVRSEGDLEVFGSPEEAAWGPEEIDIEDGVYSLWDSEGRRLRFNVLELREPRRFLPGVKKIHRVVVVEDDVEPVHAGELREVILDYFDKRMPEMAQEVRDRPLGEIVAEAARHYRVRREVP